MSAISTCPHLAKNASSQSNLLTLLIRKCVTRFLLSINTLADLGFNQGGILSMVRAIRNQLCPPRDAKNCDVCHAGGWCVTPVAIRFLRCNLIQMEKVLTGTNWKEASPVKVWHRVIEVMLTGCVGVFTGIDTLWMLRIITTQTNTLEGGRLQERGCVSASILACTSTLQSNSEPKWTPRPRWGKSPIGRAQLLL